MRRMLILPGNAAAAGKYPDEQGIKIAWPTGALHRGAAREYAWLKGYVPQVVEKSGWPQKETSPQAEEAVRWFLADQLFNLVTAFYGFSGGGGNLMHILDRLARENPETLYRIELVVVLGAPEWSQEEYELSKYNELLKKYNKRHPDKQVPLANWELEYRKNPPPDHPVVPKDPKGLDSHMFGPEWLLWLHSAEWFLRRHPSLLGGPGPWLKPPVTP
jgi:hypothetical protein